MKVSILGSGVYAKAISACLIESGCQVTMWTEKQDFKKIPVKEGTTLTNSFEEVTKDAEVIFVLTSSNFVRSVLEGIAPSVRNTSIIVLGSKGILADGTLMSELSEEILPDNPYAVISGPTFAIDIANLEPVGFTIATDLKEVFQKIAKCLKTVFLEHSKDTLAIELCGSLKNAYAIGSGILDGSGYGHSTGCLYITKCLWEMTSIFEAFGSTSSAPTSLAGIGDLMLTCTSPNSRNFTFGTIAALKAEEAIKKYLQENTVEGYENLRAFANLFAKRGISAPIIDCVHAIATGQKDKEELVKLLLKD